MACGLRRRSATSRLLRMWVRVPPGTWMSVCCECCMLSGSLCDELITCLGKSYRLWCVVERDLENSWMRRPRPTGGRGGCCAKNEQTKLIFFLIFCWPCISIYLFFNINQLDALNFIISLFQASTCFEHMCSSSGGQKLYYTVSGIITLCRWPSPLSICARDGHL